MTEEDRMMIEKRWTLEKRPREATDNTRVAGRAFTREELLCGDMVEGEV